MGIWSTVRLWSHSYGYFIVSTANFLVQEPGTEADIKKFVEKYNVRFDMFSKVNVNGDKAHPLWKYLKQKQSGFLTE